MVITSFKLILQESRRGLEKHTVCDFLMTDDDDDALVVITS